MTVWTNNSETRTLHWGDWRGCFFSVGRDVYTLCGVQCRG